MEDKEVIQMLAAAVLEKDYEESFIASMELLQRLSEAIGGLYNPNSMEAIESATHLSTLYIQLVPLIELVGREVERDVILH